MFYIVFIFATT